MLSSIMDLLKNYLFFSFLLFSSFIIPSTVSAQVILTGSLDTAGNYTHSGDPTGNLGSGGSYCLSSNTQNTVYPATTTNYYSGLDCSWYNDPWTDALESTVSSRVKTATTSGMHWVSITLGPADDTPYGSVLDYYYPFYISGGLYYQGYDYEFPNDEDFIYIDVDNQPQYLSYNDTITIVLNNTSSSTSSYLLNFVSQTGELVYTITGSTTESTTEIQENVTFTKDDILFVQAKLFTGNNFNTLIDISQEYEFWVSENANPTQTVDLGVFRTDSTDLCEESASSTIAYQICWVGKVLFLPTKGSLNYISGNIADATSTAPFSYVYDVQNYLTTFFSATSTSWTITTPSTTPVFGEFTILSSTDIDNNSNYQIIRLFMTTMLYLTLVWYVWTLRLRILN